MNRKFILPLLLVGMLIPCMASAVSEEDFKVKTTQNLINLCTATPDDPQNKEAIHFCHGYLVGAFYYHLSEHTGPGVEPDICFPEPKPTRNEVIDLFLAWVKQHPEYLSELPVETEFRYLYENWSCKK
ncbi:MAG: Rap1a/Tai family immunity protein [Gammaproteobacteria bacterium]